MIHYFTDNQLLFGACLTLYVVTVPAAFLLFPVATTKQRGLLPLLLASRPVEECLRRPCLPSRPSTSMLRLQGPLSDDLALVLSRLSSWAIPPHRAHRDRGLGRRLMPQSGMVMERDRERGRKGREKGREKARKRRREK